MVADMLKFTGNSIVQPGHWLIFNRDQLLVPDEGELVKGLGIEFETANDEWTDVC